MKSQIKILEKIERMYSRKLIDLRTMRNAITRCKLMCIGFEVDPLVTEKLEAMTAEYFS